MANRTLKKGMVLWSIFNNDQKMGVEEYHIRSIRKSNKRRSIWDRRVVITRSDLEAYKRLIDKNPDGEVAREINLFIKLYSNHDDTIVYLIQKTSFTWVKIHGRYGWDKNIPEWCKKNFSLEEYNKNGLPFCMSFSMAGAIQKYIAFYKKIVKRDKEDLDKITEKEDLDSAKDSIRMDELFIKTLERHYKHKK